MRIATLIILVFLMLTACVMPNKNMNFGNMKVVKYILDDKIISEDTLKNRSEYKIGYNIGYVLYEVPSIHLKEMKDTIDKSGRLIKRLMPSDTTYTYFIVKQGDKKGLKYDSLQIKAPSIFDSDSLLKTLSLDVASLKVYSVEAGKPISIEKQLHIEIEKYGKELPNDPDSVYRYYDSSLNDIPFSFAPLLDKKKGKKLAKTVFIYQGSKEKNKKAKPRIEAVTMIEEIKTNKPKKFVNLFQRFEKDYSKVKLH